MILLYFSLFFLIITIIFKTIINITIKNNKLKLNKNIKKDPKICVIIPARDESKVIEELLNSLENQSYPLNKDNIYVIVENESDKTVAITKKHCMQYFVRKELTKKTKGYAIDELIKYLDKKKEYYDLYFIFDADNVLDENFIINMLNDYYKGYYISTGFRGLKNPHHYLSLSSWLTFSILNDTHNTKLQKNNGNLILSGTGYFIEGSIINNFHSFPFTSLTEDYESSLYYTLKSLSTNYNKDAIFYDEQPTKYLVSIKQRARWIKGYFKNYFLACPKLFHKLISKPINKGSVIEMMLAIIPLIAFILFLVFLLLYTLLKSRVLFIIELLIIYLALLLLTIILIYKNKKYIISSNKVIIKTIFYHPIYLISYIHSLLYLIINSNLGWDKIEHNSNLTKKKN